jgi:hypothetical protein
MLGTLDVADPAALASTLNTLRERLLKDPYFKGVPSMQLEARKTALAFHAKDDLPEIRRAVFEVLAQAEVKFHAVVKRKDAVLAYVLSRNADVRYSYRYRPDELYDLTVRRLFKNLLHMDAVYNVCFAKRGASDRTGALRMALQVAQQRFAADVGSAVVADLNIWACQASDCACLQAVDYFLWALQRLYERREERYWASICDRCSVVMDVDDTGGADYGVYYNRKRPLSLAALDQRRKGI